MLRGGGRGKADRLGFRVEGLPGPRRTYLFKDLVLEIIIRNPKKVGSLVSRYGKPGGTVLLVANYSGPYRISR